MKYQGGKLKYYIDQVIPRIEGEIWWSTHQHTYSSGEPAMDKVYQQQFERSKGGGEEKKTGEEDGSWGCLGPARSSPPSTDGDKKRKGPPCREYPPVPFSLRSAGGKQGRHTYENLQNHNIFRSLTRNTTPQAPVPSPHMYYIP